jgi:hypothetical protein
VAMKPIDQQNFFELLDLPLSATTAEVEVAYERAKAFYGPDSVVTYSLVDASEARSLLERIEDAYLTLTDAQLRRAYEEELGLSPSLPPAEPEKRAQPQPAALLEEPSAERLEPSAGGAPDEATPLPPPSPVAGAEVPAPLEPSPTPWSPAGGGESPPAPSEGGELGGASAEEALPGPSAGGPSPAPPIERPAAFLDAVPSEGSASAAFPWPGSRPAEEVHEFAARALPAHEPARSAAGAGAELAAREPEPMPSAAAASLPPVAEERAPEMPECACAGAPAIPATRVEERAAEEPRSAPPARQAMKPPDIGPNSVFSGELLRRVRESRGLSLRDLSEKTRVGLGHLENVEADRYDALPVAVYLRGFLMLVARELKLDPLKVAKGYLELAAKARASKS